MRVRIAVWLVLMMFVGLAAHAQTLLGFPPGMFGKRASDVTATGCAVTCPGDLTFSGGAASFANWYSIYRCYQATYTGNVADITDASTGNTTGTRLVCSAGGVVSELVSASACTFVTGNACSSLATTCAVSCNVRQLYDQVGTQPVIQTTNGNRPLITTSCVGGKPCAVCTKASSQALISSATATVNQPFSYYAIINLVTRGTTAYAFYKNPGGTLGANSATNFGFIAAGGAANAFTPIAVTTAAWHGLSGTVQPTQQGVVNLDGTDGTAINNVGTNNTSGTIAICATTSNTLNMDGWFVEGGLNNNATPWNTSDRNLVYTNPKSYWGF